MYAAHTVSYMNLIVRTTIREYCVDLTSLLQVPDTDGMEHHDDPIDYSPLGSLDPRNYLSCISTCIHHISVCARNHFVYHSLICDIIRDKMTPSTHTHAPTTTTTTTSHQPSTEIQSNLDDKAWVTSIPEEYKAFYSSSFECRKRVADVSQRLLECMLRARSEVRTCIYTLLYNYVHNTHIYVWSYVCMAYICVLMNGYEIDLKFIFDGGCCSAMERSCPIPVTYGVYVWHS